MLVSRISLVVLGLTALAAALPAQIKALDDLTPVDRTATTMVPMRYTDVKANGEVAELFGTLPEIKAQLKWINGTLQIPFDVTPARRKVAVASIASLGRRGKGKDNGRVVCGTTGSIDNGWFGHPPEFVLEDGIKHLDHLRGNCGTGGGPGVCSRVSCSYNIGIILCNEVRFCLLHVQMRCF